MKYGLILLAVMAFQPLAEPLTVEYSTFYAHLRKIDDEELNKLQFAFGFKHVGQSALCQINRAIIHTQKVDIPVLVTPDRRFTLPTEKALKLANAEVKIDLQEPANQCDMSVQIQVIPELIRARMSVSELSDFLHQFDLFFADMGSFLSFLMPTADGIQLQFPESANLNITLDNKPLSAAAVDQHRLILNRDWFEEHQGEMMFSPEPEKITVFVNPD